MSVMIIGEPGCTAQGDHDTYLRLLGTAAECGCSCWKPQWTSNPVQMCERRHIGLDHPKRAYYERAYRWLAFPAEWHAEFAQRCHDLGMQYACSVFLPQDVITIVPIVDYLKISSFEASDPAMFDALPDDIKVIVSRGMGGRPAYAELRKIYRFSFLQCTSSYPAPIDAINLSLIGPHEYGNHKWEPGLDGLSDHSRHLLTGAVAVGKGATVIETHYRLDDCDPANPDYAVAFTPAEFTQYIANIRDAEKMLGDGVKQIQPCEHEMLPYRVGVAAST